MSSAGVHVGHGRFLSTTGQRVLALGGVVLGLAFLGHAPALVLLGIVTALLPVASVLLCGRDLSGIAVVGSVDAPQLVVGGEAPVTLHFTGAPDAAEGFLVTLTAPTIGTRRMWVDGEHGHARAVVVVEGATHGFLSEALIELEHIGPWGLSASRARAVMELPPWPVVPFTRRVPAPALPRLPLPEREESGIGRAATSGTDPRGVRAFRSGDEPRSVNWRATARLGRLTVREWDPPRLVPGVLIVPVLPDYQLAPAVTPRVALALDATLADRAKPAELVLSALGSLGLAAAAEDRALSLYFYGTQRTFSGAALTPVGPHHLAALRPADLPAVLAGVRTGALPSIAAVARSAAAVALPGSTVLLGVDLGNIHWSTEDLLAAPAAIEAVHCRLEVVVAAPHGVRPEVQAALAALAARCTVTTAESLVGPGAASDGPGAALGQSVAVG